MKNWKKLLACLLVSLMALTVFTACDGSVGAPMGPKSSDAESESVKALCKQFGVTYDEELSNKAYSIANWVSAASVSCSTNAGKTELYRVGNANDVTKTNLKQGSYASAFDSMGIGKGIGGGMGAAVLTGFKRGLFSNEAGEGSVPNAAATADASHPAVQGLIQSFGVYVDTLFICSASAFIVLLTGDYTSTGLTGIELIQWDLAQYFGPMAPKAVSILIFLFAFTSLIGNYYYGEINIGHLTQKKWPLNLFRVCIAVMIFWGSQADLPLVWNLADLFMAFMILTNVTAILLLFPQANACLKDYERQLKEGIQTPFFHKNVLPSQKGIYWWDKENNYKE